MPDKKKSTFFGDFKKFISRGSIVDLAVAVVIGAAFGKIITSLVDYIIMPLISLILNGKSFADLKWVIKEAVYSEGILVQSETALGYGAFIQSAIDFLLIAFCIFVTIRIMSKAKSKLERLTEQKKAIEPAAPPIAPKPTQEELLTEIRDILKNKK